MKKLFTLVSLFVSFNLFASSATDGIKGFVLTDGTRLLVNQDVKEISFDHDKIGSVELNTGHIIDPVEIEQVIPNNPHKNLSSLLEQFSRIERVFGGDGSGGG